MRFNVLLQVLKLSEMLMTLETSEDLWISHSTFELCFKWIRNEVSSEKDPPQPRQQKLAVEAVTRK